jgi:type I restriction enzyme S subunit
MKKAWQTKKLHEVCELINGRAYRKPELLADGKYRVLRVGNFFTNDHWYYSDLELEDKKYCDTGDLLYAWSASFGPRLWTGGKVIYHYHIWKVVHDHTQIDQKFLFYFFQWDTEKIKEDQGTGTTMMHVSMGSMNERDIALPPLTEQKRIVAILDKAFLGLATAKANADKNLLNARALFKSHLQSVFTLHDKGWVEKRIDALYRVGSSKRVLKSQWKSEGVPFYRGREVTRLATDGFVTNELFISEKHFAEVSQKYGVPKAGDIVITAIGTIGNSHVVRDCDRFYFKDASVLWLKRITDVSSEFVNYWFNSYLFFEQLDRCNGATVDTLTIQKLQSVEIQVPPKGEQLKIVAILDALSEEVQQLVRIYEQKLTILDELKQSLLHQAFSGQL